MGKEAQVILATLSQLMDAKIEEPISHVKGWVNGQIAIMVTRSYYRMLCIDRFSSTLRTYETIVGGPSMIKGLFFRLSSQLIV